jgi:hypothetical protein
MPAATDGFATVQSSFEGPARSGEAVTPSDSADLTNVSRALWVGTGGDLTVTMQDGSTVALLNVPDGSLLPICVSRVKLTGTSATDIVALS